MLGFTRMLFSAIVCLSLLVGTVLGVSDLPPWIVEKGLQGDPRVEVGCLPVTLYDGWEGNAVDPTGKKDSTKAIRQAIHDAYQFDMVCFFPIGTYLVSDTLECVQRVIPRKAGKDNKNYFPAKKEFTLVGSTKGARPVIKLANHSPGFDDESKPKAVVHIWSQAAKTQGRMIPASEDPETEQPNIAFRNVYKGIDIHIGPKSNRGATGIRYAGAQGSAIEDVRIVATGAFAGVHNLPARTGLTVNIEVIGGKYGVYVTSSGIGSTIAGLTLKGQTERSIYYDGWVPLTIVGVDIEKAKGPIITTQIKAGGKGSGVLNLVDGAIRLGETGLAIDNSLGRSLYLRNVYFHNAHPILKSAGAEPIEGSKGWMVAKEYAYGTKGDFVGWVDGKAFSETVVNIDEANFDCPADLVSRHLYGPDFPSFEDADAVNVKTLGAKGDGQADDSAALQAAIDKHKKVFMPKGVYLVTKTLTLGEETQLFGIGKTLTHIRPDFDKWKPTKELPIIQTVDDPNAVTSMSFLSIDVQFTDIEHCYFNQILWRAGRHSIVRDIGFGHVDWVNPTTSDGTARVSCRITGNGGGKWYTFTMPPHHRGRHPDYRHLLVEGTKEPLSFYGLNIERAPSDAQGEIRDACNVRIYNFKVEHAHGLRINRSNNVMLLGYWGSANTVEVIDSQNVLLANITGVGRGEPEYVVKERSGNDEQALKTAVYLFKRGRFKDFTHEENADVTRWIRSQARGPESSSRTREQRTWRKNRMNQPSKEVPEAPPEETPDFADISYGPHERNVLDFWKTESASPTPVLVYFHGGGFSHGNKNVAASMVRLCREAGISLAAANYRLSHHAPYPAQMHDSARAIQLLRSKAKEWNIDPTRFAAYGASAGAGISLWLAFHDDMADPDSADPVARQSTRLSCAVGFQAQATYDPREIKKVVPGRAYNHGELKRLFGLPREWDWDTDTVDEELSAKLRDGSPIHHLTQDDPPVFVYHRKEQEVSGNIHHANFGRYLKEKMAPLEIECVLHMDTDYESEEAKLRDMLEFVSKHFGMKD